MIEFFNGNTYLDKDGKIKIRVDESDAVELSESFDMDELLELLEYQIKHENFEGADIIKKAIKLKKK